MGDDGELYSTYTQQMRDRMYELCELADIITPNLTEACFLSGAKYIDTSDYSELMAQSYVSRLVGKLYLPKRTKIVVTGVSHSNDKFGTFGILGKDVYDGNIGYFYSVDRVKKSYPGTGDLFASVLLGGILCGKPLDDALRFASEHIREVMEYSSKIDTPVRNGVAFEHFLYELAEYSRS
jgi:pyridoxine kinase